MPRNATYYAGDLRRDLLDAALGVVAEQGPAAVSLRALARHLGVSHAAPANHFADKRALFTALAREGFELLGRTFADAAGQLPPGTPAVEVLGAQGRAYVGFALAHRGHFAVMWRVDLHDRDDPALAAASATAYAALADGVAAAQAQGWAADQDAATVAATLWSAVHGLAVLWLDGPLHAQVGDGPEALADAVVGLLLRLG